MRFGQRGNIVEVLGVKAGGDLFDVDIGQAAGAGLPSFDLLTQANVVREKLVWSMHRPGHQRLADKYFGGLAGVDAAIRDAAAEHFEAVEDQLFPHQHPPRARIEIRLVVGGAAQVAA